MYDYIVRDPFSLSDKMRSRGDRLTGDDAKALETDPENAPLVHLCVRVERPAAAPNKPAFASAPAAPAPDKS